MPPHIPGFYYDETKGRYFKIQPNHAVPHGFKYSAQSIKLQQENTEHEEQKAKTNSRNRKGRIQKHPALQHPLIGGFRLTSEASISRVDPSTVVHNAWAKGLDPEWSIEDPKGKQAEIRHFVYDDASTCFIYNLIRDESSFIQSGFLGPQSEGSMTPFQSGKLVTEASYQLLLTLGIEISSISIDVNRVVLFTTYDTMFLRKLIQPEIFNDQRQHTVLDNMIDHPAVNISVHTDIWCSAARQLEPGFAVGHTGCVNVITPRESGWDFSGFSHPRGSKLSSTDRVQAVDWLDRNTIVEGVRSGKVLLMDLRSRDSAIRILHRKGIHHVRTLGNNKVVIAGMKNQLCTYDLRYLPMTKPQNPTEPYIKFPDYASNDVIRGFDVSQNLIVSGAPNGTLQVFNSHTGEEIERQWALIQGNEGWRQEDTVKSLRFVDGVGRKDSPHLLVAAGNELSGWC